MTTASPPDTADSLGTTAKTVRFPTMLAERLASEADDADRSFSSLVVSLCRAVERPGRAELEVPDGDGRPPVFQLVKPRDGTPVQPVWGGESATETYDVMVSGVRRPEMRVTKYGSGEEYLMEVQTPAGPFGAVASSYVELWKQGWLITTCLDMTPAASRQADDRWFEPSEAQRGYQLDVRFHLTPFSDPGGADDQARLIQKQVSSVVHQHGGRDVSTDLHAVAAMSAAVAGELTVEVKLEEVVEVLDDGGPVASRSAFDRCFQALELAVQRAREGADEILVTWAEEDLVDAMGRALQTEGWRPLAGTVAEFEVQHNPRLIRAVFEDDEGKGREARVYLRRCGGAYGNGIKGIHPDVVVSIGEIPGPDRAEIERMLETRESGCWDELP